MSIDQWKLTYRTDKEERRTLLVLGTSKAEVWKSAIGYEQRCYNALAVELISISWNGTPNGAKGIEWFQEVPG